MDATEAAFFRSLYGPRAKAVRRRMSAADAIQLQRLLRVEKNELEGGGVLNDAAWLIRDTTGAMFDEIRDAVQHTAAGARRAVIFVRKLLSTLAGLDITVLSAVVVHYLTHFMRQYDVVIRANQKYMDGVARLRQMRTLMDGNMKELWANILSVPWSEKPQAMGDAYSLLAAQADHMAELIPPVQELEAVYEAKKVAWDLGPPEELRDIVQQLHRQIGLIGAEVIHGVFLTQGLADAVSGFARLVVHLLRTRRGWDISAKKGKRIAFLGRWVGNVCGVLMTHIMLVHSAAPFAAAAVGLVAAFTIIAELFRWLADLPATSTELIIAAVDQISKVSFAFPTWALSLIAGDKK